MSTRSIISAIKYPHYRIVISCFSDTFKAVNDVQERQSILNIETKLQAFSIGKNDTTLVYA
ncbi:hypothetical protein TUM4249_13140 [Shewanella sp. KT0246]|nr:hypothetical protein TUM4249_13140 [Shewanella sp. KT0246]